MRQFLACALMFTSLSTQAQETVDGSFINQFQYRSMAEWQPGMQFMVEPPSIHNLSVEIDLVPYQSKNLTTLRLMQSDYQGKLFLFTGTEIRKIERCVEDDCNRTFLIFESDGKKYEYSSFFSMGAIKEFSEASVSGLVYYDEIEKCREMLVGKKIWVLDAPWRSDDMDKAKPMGKYLPVTVTSVGIGTQDGPVKIRFKAEGYEGEYFINARISGINKATGEFGTEFAKAFSFEDPKTEFTEINYTYWHQIQHRKVANGMGKKECALSWGKPDKISSSRTNDEEIETWSYGLSRSVTFRNGTVESFVD